MLDRDRDRADARARFAAALGDTALDVTLRDRRWLALGPDVVAFASVDAASWRRLALESALLARWRAAGLPAPRVLAEDAARGVQIRERLHGLTGDAVEPLIFGGAPPDARGRFAPATPITPFGARLAASYGELAARLHGAVDAVAGADLGLAPRPPIELDDLRARLHAALAPDEHATLAAFDRLRDELAVTRAPDAVVHGDLHFHNLCLAPTGDLVGVFDLDEARLDDGWADLHYAPSVSQRFGAIAIAAYAAARGVAPDERAVERAHLRTALEHLRWHPPGAPRHASIVAWVTAALARA